ncbi:hypothetical protein [Roseateles saccharophilus]|uniref:Uncharacterized protein n=1 Tax=Roseateles saccharophilus TaxID=304 RepID=A0A4R3UN03_ROSSA|nr:hypothetical protein [Roseateles saccharophilus]MDG0836106.1 hypothetical protein [Roseateles saccharophilus]TCU91364.1 hypothetical protein EV671_102683 [Roseateles saccharophilus]
MKTLLRWIAALPFTPLAVLTLQGLALNAQALTDTNAELKAAAADRAAGMAIVAGAKPARPARMVWVPPTARALDGFKPLLPPAPADAPARAGVRRG